MGSTLNPLQIWFCFLSSESFAIYLKPISCLPFTFSLSSSCPSLVFAVILTFCFSSHCFSLACQSLPLCFFPLSAGAVVNTVLDSPPFPPSSQLNIPKSILFHSAKTSPVSCQPYNWIPLLPFQINTFLLYPTVLLRMSSCSTPVEAGNDNLFPIKLLLIYKQTFCINTEYWYQACT